MANLSLTYTLANGTTADATEVQTNFNDGVTYINARNAGSADWDIVSSAGLITAKANMRANDGTAATPSISFTSETDCGVYLDTTNTVGLSAGGTLRLSISDTIITAVLPIRGVDGSAAAPGFSFTGDTDNGIYLSAADTVGVSAGGTLRFSVSGTIVTSTLPVYGANGSAAAPSYTLTADSDTGMYREDADKLGFATGGGRRFVMTSTENATYVHLVPGISGTYNLGASTLPFGKLYMAAGLVGTPAITFGADTDSGIYNSAADELAFATGGGRRFVITSTANATYVDIVPGLSSSYNLGTTSLPFGKLYMAAGLVGTPAFTFGADPDTGIYSIGADNFGISAGGVLALQVEDPADLGATEVSLRVYDKDNTALVQVTVGAADSGGGGFKVLRIPN